MIQTNCSGCVFAIIENNKQTGCKLNRIEKLESVDTAEHNDVEYKTLSRFCNAYRPEPWLQSLSLEESLQTEKTVLEEIKPRIGFLIYLDDDKEEFATQYLEATLTDIRDQTDSVARYVIVATDKVEYNNEIHELLLKFFNKEDTFVHILQLSHIPEDKNFIVDEAFRLALNGWLYVTTSGERVDRNLLQDIHEHINIKMNKLSVVLPYDGINGLMFQTALFKYVNGNKTKLWDIDHSDDRMFLEKIKDLDNTGDCILVWSEVNAS